MERICEDCGEANPSDAEFCRNCNAFLAWDRTSLSRTASERTPPPTVNAAPAATGSTPIGQAAQPLPDEPRQAAPTPGYATANPVDRRVDTSHQRAANDGLGARDTATLKACPHCGYGNPTTVRFCIRCGTSFAAAGPPTSSQQPSARSAAASAAAADRAARREYRRSLPPFYRWRRVGIGVVVAAALIAGAVFLRDDPVGFVKDGWYWLNQQYVPVKVVAASIDPPSAAARGSDPAKLIDGSVQEFTMNWTPPPEGPSSCGAAPGTGWITLTIVPTRVRKVVIWSGLAKDNPNGRAQQPLPKTGGIRFDDGECQPFELSDTTDPISLYVDSGHPITQVHIGIATASGPAGPDAAQISLTEIALKAYPS